MKDALVPVAVALLCIVALGLGAATISTDLSGSGESGSLSLDGLSEPSNESEESVDDPDVDSQDAQQTEFVPEDDECIAGYNQTDLTWIVTAVALGVSVLVFARTRELMLGAVTFPIIMVPATFLLLFVFIYLGCPVPGEEIVTAGGDQEVSAEEFGEAFGGGDEGEESAPLSDRLRLGGFFLAIVLSMFLVGLYLTRRNSSESGGEQVIEAQASETNAEIAAAAGDAADELGDETETQNSVYRAWAKMAEALDVEHPDTSTPREFADAALSAGLDEDDVSELTELFEEVRYGTTTVTREQEERARAVLRRIERTYADEPNQQSAADEGG